MDEPPVIHDGEVVEIYALAEGGVIRNHSFINCEIVGPAVLGTTESIFRHNATTNKIDFAVYNLKPTQVGVAGAIIVQRCSFENCLFRMVGFVPHHSQYEAFKGMLRERGEIGPPK